VAIERTDQIKWHAAGTLRAVTRWINGHDEGVAELLKNTRRAYQVDRLNVAEEHRAAVILLRDGDPAKSRPARIGVLDVGGAGLDDVEAWSVWHDPEASNRRSGLDEEETQGNGGKAYLYALFTGQCLFLGVADRTRNCMGFEGEEGSEARGTPGWIPTRAKGREVGIASFDAELRSAIQPYGIRPEDLPPKVLDAMQARQAFTLVEGVGPTGLYKTRVDADDLISKVLRHEQCTLVVDQIDIFAMHNGRLINGGKKLQLPPIPPYPGIEHPEIFPVPEQLESVEGQLISSTEGGTRDPGRLVIYTSSENMYTAYKNLRPRWRMSYKAGFQMIGSKSIGELAPGTSGAAFIYGTVELPALEPGYVETGRKRPKNGPLVEALDRFISQKIRDVAKKVNDLRKQVLDDQALEQVQQENRLLDAFKNTFLPSSRGAGGSSGEEEGSGKATRHVQRVTGTDPEELEYVLPEDGLHIAQGVSVRLPYLLQMRITDQHGKPVPGVRLDWSTSDRSIAVVGADGLLEGKSKGKCDVRVRVVGTGIQSDDIPVRVWTIEHVLLSPREIEMHVGRRERIVAEVTDDDGDRSTEVLLDWRHDADDPLILRIGPRGWVTGNREGRSAVSAGAGDVWSRRPAEVTVLPSETKSHHSGGFPELLLTDKDVDPTTGRKREGNPDAPALWQETADFLNNIWWLNLQSAEAAYAFHQRAENPHLWRMFHVGKLMEMVQMVWLDDEYTSKGDGERPDYWSTHRATLEIWKVLSVQQMWAKLEAYVRGGRLEID
jgi:hypothetical protein